MKRETWGLIIIGFIFLLIGVPFAGIGWWLGNQAEALAQKPVFTMASLATSPPGQAGTLEGRIAERNPLQFRTFVAYLGERYDGEDCDDDGCDSIWTEIERQAPPLLLDLPAGRLQIVNADYQLESLPVTWQTSDDLVEYQTVRYRGFEIGSPVFVVGRTARAGDTPAFTAELIAGGDRASYLAGQRFEARLFFWLGTLFSLIGAGAIGWFLYKLAR